MIPPHLQYLSHRRNISNSRFKLKRKCFLLQSTSHFHWRPLTPHQISVENFNTAYIVCDDNDCRRVSFPATSHRLHESANWSYIDRSYALIHIRARSHNRFPFLVPARARGQRLIHVVQKPFNPLQRLRDRIFGFWTPLCVTLRYCNSLDA